MKYQNITLIVFLHVRMSVGQDMKSWHAIEDVVAGPESQRRHGVLTPNAAPQPRKESEIVGDTDAD